MALALEKERDDGVNQIHFEGNLQEADAIYWKLQQTWP